MDKGRDTAENVASSNRYVLCKMPADWTTLPVHGGLQSPPSRNSIAVYTKTQSNKGLVYKGYICPTAPEKVAMSALLPPPRGERFGQKYARLLEKIRAEEAAARAKITSEDQGTRAADAAASSKQGRGVVNAEPSAVPGREDAADESTQPMKQEAIATSESKNQPEHLNPSLQRMEFNTDHPFPLEILDRMERLLSLPPAGETEDFMYCFEPWEDSSVPQFSLAATPEDTDISPNIYMELS